MLLVSIHSVDVALWGHTLLQDITFELAAGQHWALLGHNGAGKTSLLRLLRGELAPHPQSRGQRLYHLDGVPHPSPIGAKEQLALVSAEAQDAYALHDWPVRVEDVVRSGFGDAIWPDRLLSPAEEAQVEAALVLLDLTALRARPLVELSTGQARRCILARALAPKPRVLLLDEFLNGLDASSRTSIQEAIFSRVNDGLTTVQTCHRQSDLLPFTTHAAVLDHGRIIQSGTRDEVLDGWLKPSAVPAQPSMELLPPPPSFTGEFLFEVEGEVRIDGQAVLRDLHWKVRPGEHWAIRGPNGAGKSTLLRLLQGEEQVAEGGYIRRLEFGEQANVWAVKKRVAVVSPALHARHRADYPAEDVVVSGLFSSIGLIDTPTPADREAAERWMQAFGVGHLKGRGIFSVSYGEQRRLLLARALITNPQVVLLDEPCSGLDSHARGELLRLIEKLAQSGRTIITSTHHDDELPACITHEVVLRDGTMTSAARLSASEPS